MVRCAQAAVPPVLILWTRGRASRQVRAAKRSRGVLTFIRWPGRLWPQISATIPRPLASTHDHAWGRHAAAMGHAFPHTRKQLCFSDAYYDQLLSTLSVQPKLTESTTSNSCFRACSLRSGRARFGV